MKLQELLKNIKPLRVEGSTDVEITGVNIDSRKIKDGHLFVAMKGTQTDGHKFIPKALELGAKAVLCEDMPEQLADGVTYVQVESTEDAVGKVATLFHGDPSKHLTLVGVTGTNGKTTIATLLYNMFREFGYRCGLLSTVCNYIDGKPIPADHTTPDPIELNELLGEMVKAGCQYAFMECSSHAIHQKRIGGLKFAGGIFTNLTRDHLDYHKTFENYRNAKKAFFDGLPKSAFAITNADDKNGMIMVQNTKATVKTYSIRQMADFRAHIIEMHFAGMYLEVDGHEVGVQFIGKFNVSNLLAVYAAARMLGKEPEFLADLTIRHPENDNAELLWHCGPFAYSLKAENSTAKLVGGQEQFELKQGDLTLCRFDDDEDGYYLFAGEATTTTGPETTGTYVWMQTDNWKAWEEKLMFGPYIHHLGGIYGKMQDVLREVARYLDVKFDYVGSDGPRCL